MYCGTVGVWMDGGWGSLAGERMGRMSRMDRGGNGVMGLVFVQVPRRYLFIYLFISVISLSFFSLVPSSLLT